MKSKILFFAVLPLLLVAADKLTPLNAKLGLWEMATTMQLGGVPPIPPETLAKMTPDQRAQVEAMFKSKMGQGAAPRVTQSCVTQEKLDKAVFSEDKKSCQRTVVNSTSKLIEFHEECTEPDGSKRTADGKFELSGDSSMKGTMLGKAINKGRTMDINVNISGKWISADCGKAN
jgi:hypothetical protein